MLLLAVLCVIQRFQIFFVGVYLCPLCLGSIRLWNIKVQAIRSSLLYKALALCFFGQATVLGHGLLKLLQVTHHIKILLKGARNLLDAVLIRLIVDASLLVTATSTSPSLSVRCLLKDLAHHIGSNIQAFIVKFGLQSSNSIGCDLSLFSQKLDDVGLLRQDLIQNTVASRWRSLATQGIGHVWLPIA